MKKNKGIEIKTTGDLMISDAYKDIISPYVKVVTAINNIDDITEVKLASEGTFTVTATGSNGTYSYTYPATTYSYTYPATTISSIPGMWQLPPEEDDYLDGLEESLKDGESELHIANTTFNQYRNEIMDLLLKYKYVLYKDPMGNLNYKEIRKIS